jgi:hypothetical protein
MLALADYLLGFDYVALTLVRGATGHLFLERAAINDAAVTLCLDTGAGRTVVDVTRARALGLTLTEVGRGAGGAGATSMPSFRTQLARLDLGALAERDFAAHAIDLSHVNKALSQRGERPMDGVLGADLLDARHAVIDYHELRLFLKRETHPAAA